LIIDICRYRWGNDGSFVMRSVLDEN